MHLRGAYVEPPIRCAQPIHEVWVVPPIVNLLLEISERATLQVKLQQTTLQQLKQTWGLQWGRQRRFGLVHLDVGTRCTCSLEVEGLTLLSESSCNIVLTA